MGSEFEYIVVGAGSSGSVIANRLSAEHSVLLLEAGGSSSHWKAQVPAAAILCWLDPALDWGFKAGPEPYANNRVIHHERAKMLGGCSSHNAMFYIRGNPADYDQWAEMTNCAEWSYESVLPLFKKSERHLTREDQYHGREGEMKVVPNTTREKTSELFVLAAQEAGFKLTDDFNGPQQEGFGFSDSTSGRDGYRCSADKAFIDGIRHRKNLTVLQNCLADKLVFDTDKKCTGIEVIHNNRRTYFAVSREVILSAGSFGSPCILQRSGVGDHDLMKQLGIPLVHNSPGVGNNLLEHPAVTLNYELKTGYGVDQAFRAASEELLSKSGKISAEDARDTYEKAGLNPSLLFFPLFGIVKSEESDPPKPDLQLYHLPGGAATIGRTASIAGRNMASACVSLLPPTSTGHVNIVSRDPQRRHPEIILNLLEAKEDVERLKTGLKMASSIIHQPSYRPLLTGREITDVSSDATLERHLRDNTCHTYHPVSTCRMGVPGDPLAVCDWAGRVAGVKGVRVADASIMPTAVTGNTNAPCIMIGERISDFILRGH